MSDTPTTPAGWYDDGSGRRRYWDGAAWTEHYEPAAPAAPAAPVAPVEAAPVPAVPAAPTATLAPPIAATAASAAPADSKPGLLGLIALGIAAVGFIFACIPGALIVGWVLLPVAFVLAIVAFFQKGRKWPAIVALIVSVVGTIVGIVVFFTVVAVAFTNAFGDTDSEVAPPADSSEVAEDDGDDEADEGASGEVGSRENPAPIGSTIEGDDYTVVVNSVTLNADDAVLAAASFNEPAGDGLSYMVVNATITYTGDESGFALFTQFGFVATSGEVYSGTEQIVAAPEPALGLDELFTGGSATGNIVIAIPADGDGVLRVTPGIIADPVFVSVR